MAIATLPGELNARDLAAFSIPPRDEAAIRPILRPTSSLQSLSISPMTLVHDSSFSSILHPVLMLLVTSVFRRLTLFEVCNSNPGAADASLVTSTQSTVNPFELWASSGRHGRHLSVAQMTTVVNIGQPRLLETASIYWASDENPWSGRRESNSRSQLGKLRLTSDVGLVAIDRRTTLNQSDDAFPTYSCSLKT